MLLDNSKIFVPGISRNFWINLQLMELKCIKQKVSFYFFVCFCTWAVNCVSCHSCAFYFRILNVFVICFYFFACFPPFFVNSVYFEIAKN